MPKDRMKIYRRANTAEKAKKIVPLERSEAKALMDMIDRHEFQMPELRWFHAIPNSGTHHAEQGVRKGVPDYAWPVRCGDAPGLVVELKRMRGGVTSTEQRDWIEHYRNQGWTVAVAEGWEQAWHAIVTHWRKGIARPSTRSPIIEHPDTFKVAQDLPNYALPSSSIVTEQDDEWYSRVSEVRQNQVDESALQRFLGKARKGKSNGQ